MKTFIRTGLAGILFSTVLAGCDSSDSEEIILPQEPGQALVQTVAPDYTSSEVVLVDVENEQVQTGLYIKDKSDYTLAANGDDIFHIGRYFIDTISKYNASALETEVWTFSTQDNEDSISRNPYSLVFASANKAYLLRYGSDKVWIVNPQASQAEDFKIGELDLSAYVENNSSNTPNPSAAVIHNGLLFIAMQRLDDNWSAQTAYVAVFDTETDMEMETNASTSDSVKGVPLAGLNPLEHSLYAFDNEVFVTSRDSYSSFDFSGSKIEAIDVNNFSRRDVVLGSDLSANIKSAVVVNENKGYFYTSQSVYEPSYHEVSSLYEFNPTTGEVTAENVAGSGSEGINFITLDEVNYLWVSVASNESPGVDVVDTDTNLKYLERLLTDLNPSKIVFLQD